MDPNRINTTLVDVKVDNKQVLFIMLDNKGAINRIGDGSPDCQATDLFTGNSSQNGFRELLKLVNEDMLQFCGNIYDIPDKEGRTCEMTVMFSGIDLETGFKVIYGEHSQGPPRPVVDYVIKAVSLTEKWYLQKVASK